VSHKNFFFFFFFFFFFLFSFSNFIFYIKVYMVLVTVRTTMQLFSHLTVSRLDGQNLQEMSPPSLSYSGVFERLGNKNRAKWVVMINLYLHGAWTKGLSCHILNCKWPSLIVRWLQFN